MVDRIIEFEMKLPARVHQEDGWFIASCDPLDVHSQGKSDDEARRNLVEALQLFIESCYERGTLDTVLKQCGLKPSQEHAPADSGVSMLRVPFSLIAESDAQAHAC